MESPLFKSYDENVKKMCGAKVAKCAKNVQKMRKTSKGNYSNGIDVISLKITFGLS